MSAPTPSVPTIGTFANDIYKQVNEIQERVNSVFTLEGNLALDGGEITVGEITVGTLNYTTLNPPVSSGGNVTAPPSSTDNAIARFSGVTGGLLENSPVVLTDSGQFQIAGSTIDMSVPGTINLIATHVNANASSIVVSTGPAVSGDIPVFSGVSGMIITDSGVQVSAINNKLPLAGGTMTGAIDMSGNNIAHVGSISGASTTRTADMLVSSIAVLSTDSDVAVFSGTTGLVIKESGVPVSSIVNKLPLTGGTMAGDINMAGHAILDVATISGGSNTSNVDNLVTSAAGSATTGDIAVFSGATGRVIGESGIQASSIATKLPLSGGTMSGSIAMGGNSLTGVLTIAGSVKTANVNSIVTSDAVATTVGNIPIFDNATGTSLSDSGLNFGNLVQGPVVATDQAIARYNGTSGDFLENSAITLSNSGVLAANSNTIDFSTPGVLNLTSASVQANGSPVITSAIIGSFMTGPVSAVDSNIVVFNGTSGTVAKDSGIPVSSIATKLPFSGGTMTGAIAMGGNNITNVGVISGGANSRLASNIVSNGGAAADGNVAIFSGISGKVIIDTGASLSQYLPLTGGTLSGSLNMSGNNITGLASVAGPTYSRTADNIVSNLTGAASGNLAMFSGLTGKVITDSGSAPGSFLLRTGGTMTGAIAMGGNNITNIGTISGSANTSTVDNLVITSAVSSTPSNIVVFSDTSGRSVMESGIAVSSITSKLPLAGGTMTGNINMGGNNITSVGTFSGPTNSRSADSVVSSIVGVSVDSDIAVFNGTTGVVIKESSIPVSSIATKLPLAGGTMSGAIAMGGNNITNIGSISGASKTSLVDQLVTSTASGVTDSNFMVFNGTSGTIAKDGGIGISSIATKLPLAGGTMSGAIDMAGNNILHVGSISGASTTRTADTIVSSTSSVSVDSDIAVFNGTTGIVLKESSIPVSSIATKLPLAGGTMTGDINMNGNNMTHLANLGGLSTTRATDNIVSNGGAAGAINNVAVFADLTGKVITDSGASLSQYLPLAGGTMTGSVAMGGNNITNVGTLSGGSNSPLVANIVSNPSSSTSGDVAVFSGTTGKLITDTNVVSANLVANTGASTNGDVAVFSGITGKVITDTSIVSANLVANTGTSTSGDVAVFSGTTGKVITDTSIVSANLVTNSGASVSGNVATFSGVSGKIVTDSGTSLSAYLPLAGGTMSGNIAMGTHNITGVGVIVPNAGVNIGSGTSTGDNTQVAIGLGAAASASQSIALGNQAATSGTSGIAVGYKANATVADSIAIGDDAVNTTANSCLIGDALIANIRAASTVCDLGTSGVKFQNLFLSGSITGSATTTAANNIVGNVSTSTNGDVAVFSGTTGKVITDTSIISANLVTNSGASTSGDVATFSGTSGKIVTDSGIISANIVTNSGASTSGDVATFSGTSGKIVTDSGIISANLVSNSGAATSGNVATFSGISGKIIADSGSSLSQYLPLAGGTMSGSIALGGNNLSGVGLIIPTTNIQIGASASAGNTDSIAIGHSATAGNLNSIALGEQANAGVATSQNIAIGAQAASNGGDSVGIGSLVTSSGQYAVAIGRSSVASGGDSICIGRSSSSSNGEAIALGHAATAGGSDAIALGGNSTASATNSIAIGNGANNATANSCLIGDAAIVNIRPNDNATCDLGTASAQYQNIYLSGSVIGSSTTTAANSIVSGPASAASGNVATFNGTTGKIVQDSGASLSQYLLLAGGTMSGSINMGTNNITNVTQIAAVNSIHIGTSVSDGAPGNDNVLIGTTVTGSGIDVASSGSVAIGNSTTVISHGQIAIGVNSTAGATSTPNCLAIGLGASSVTSNSIAIGNTAAASVGNGAIALGNSSIASNTSAIAIGDTSTASASGSITIGASATNATTNSCLIGNSSIANIRPNNTGTCDLGASGAKYQNLYLSGSIEGSLTVTGVNNIVSYTTASAIAGNVVTFSGTTGKIIQDSGKALSAYLPLAGGTMSGGLDMGNNGISNTHNVTPASGNFSLGTSANPYSACYLTDGTVASFLQFAMYSPVTIAGTVTTFTSMLTGATAQGSLTIHAGTGYVAAQNYEIIIPYTITMNNTQQINLQVTVDGTSILSLTPLFGTASLSAIDGIIRFYMIISPTNYYITMERHLSANVNLITHNTGSFSNATHTLDVQAEWGASNAGNSFVAQCAIIKCNGRTQ